MRKTLTRGVLSVLLFVPGLWATKVEKEAKKLDKELKKISLVAADLDGRRVVNRVMAKQLGVSRKQLVNERRQTDFVYGQLFGAHEVAREAGIAFSQVAEQMTQGHSLLDISEQHELDLKVVLADAKKLNKGIDKELDRVASGEENEQADDSADGYDPAGDSLSADTAEFTPAQVAQAKEQVHQRGGPFGQGGPFGAGRGVGGEMGGGRGQGSSVGGGASPGASGGRGPH